jgi:hypothetical protein
MTTCGDFSSFLMMLGTPIETFLITWLTLPPAALPPVEGDRMAPPPARDEPLALFPYGAPFLDEELDEFLGPPGS